MLKVVDEKHARFLPVADEAVKALEEVAALYRDAHVGHQRKELDPVRLCQFNDALDNLLVKVDLQHHGIRLRKDLIALFAQQIHKRQHVRTFGKATRHVPVVVKHRQP